MSITPDSLSSQEQLLARAFREKDLEIARPLYHPEVVYLSPTVRLYDWPRRIEGIDRALEFVALTIAGCEDIDYRAVESACLDDGSSAFVHVHFDWTMAAQRLRSSYVVLYRYREGRIERQELYYDPGSPPERLD